MTENKNIVEVVEQNNEVAVTEEKKEGIVKKAGKFVKANWKKGVTLAVVGVGGFLLGAHAAGKSEGCDADDCEVIEADDLTVVEDYAE